MYKVRFVYLFHFFINALHNNLEGSFSRCKPIGRLFSFFCIGDHVTEWNGRSLVNATFEEAQAIVRQSGDIVQIIVIHDNKEYVQFSYLMHNKF